jgi:hypothetical protein
MNFWDASAIVPLAVAEPASARLRGLVGEEPDITVWWATGVECMSAISRRERTGALPTDEAVLALGTLDQLATRWIEILPTEALRLDARRMVRVHDLRAADAFQLAAARSASEQRPEHVPIVTLDDRLALAARREGFRLLPT